jgi:hypothetical protein
LQRLPVPMTTLEATAKTPFEQELGYVMAMPCAFW